MRLTQVIGYIPVIVNILYIIVYSYIQLIIKWDPQVCLDPALYFVVYSITLPPLNSAGKKKRRNLDRSRTRETGDILF